MKVCILIFLLACSAAPSLRGQEQRCPDARTTVAMRECLTRELGRADRALDSLVDSFRAVLGDLAGRRLLSATDRWKAYRTSECDAVQRSFEGGTVGPVAQLSCLLDLAEDRRTRLGAFYATLADSSSQP